MEVVNRVFRGRLSHPPDYLVLEAMCFLQNIPYKIHRGRPTMFCVKFKPKQTALFFSSGRFRVMGQLTLEMVKDLMRSYLSCLDIVELTLQTTTVKFRVKPVTPDFVNQHHEDLIYEPELFPAIRVIRWPSMHVNLFHSGAVVVLGQTASNCAPSVKAWLEQAQSKEGNTTVSSSSSFSDATTLTTFPDYDTVIQHLPQELQGQAYKYLQHYPLRLVNSWSRRIATDPELRKQLIANINSFS